MRDANEGYCVMRQEQEDLTRALASALWRSALSPYCRALDNWLVAETMVAEALRAAQEAPEPRPDAVAPPVRSLPSQAFPVEYVRDLAQCFWEHSTRSAALTLDIWLAAERHVLAFCHAALSGHGAGEPFSAEVYWQRIRDHADWLWLERGRPQDRDLDTWLKAEAQVLAQTAAGSNAGPAPVMGDGGTSRRATRALRRPLALTMLEEEGPRAVVPSYPPAVPEHPGAQPSLS